MSDQEGTAELNIQLDPSGNLVIKNLDPDSLRRLRQRLESVSAVSGSEAAKPKLRVTAVVEAL